MSTLFSSIMIDWKDAATHTPDADTTVLIHCPAEDEPVWMGYFDGEEWRSVEGVPVEVTDWADMPEGPKR
jgi:hypothetical protein